MVCGSFGDMPIDVNYYSTPLAFGEMLRSEIEFDPVASRGKSYEQEQIDAPVDYVHKPGLVVALQKDFCASP